MNVVLGERYKTITKETRGMLTGEYGATPQPVNAELQRRVLGGKPPITCRPADLIEPELAKLTAELDALAKQRGFSAHGRDDVLTYALFPDVGLRFLEHRGDPSKFEPAPGTARAKPAPAAVAPTTPASAPALAERYAVTVNGRTYDVEVAPSGTVQHIGARVSVADVPAAALPEPPVAATKRLLEDGTVHNVKAPLAGTVLRVLCVADQDVQAGDVVFVLEAMKMEIEVRAPCAGAAAAIAVRQGDAVEAGRVLVQLV
jgi:oxaloacetate decarboxylase alpha subunit